MGTSITSVEKTSLFSVNVSIYTTLGATFSKIAILLSSSVSAHSMLAFLATLTCSGGIDIGSFSTTGVDGAADAVSPNRRKGIEGENESNFLRLLSSICLLQQLFELPSSSLVINRIDDKNTP